MSTPESEILKYSVEGYLDGKLQKASARRGINSRFDSDLFRSKKLDRINITSHLFTQEDVDDLIKFLQIVKYCL